MSFLLKYKSRPERECGRTILGFLEYMGWSNSLMHVISNIFGWNPMLHLIFLNVILHQYCCIFFVAHMLWVQALLLTVELNFTALHSCQLGKTKHLLCQVIFCIPISPPAPHAYSHCPHSCTNDTLFQASSHPSQVLLLHLLPSFKAFPSRKGDPPSVLLAVY